MNLSSVVRSKGPTILLSSGRYFDFLDPEGSDLLIEDIAHGLSNICRFNGQCRTFYSVAQHSVLASVNIAPEFAYAALMHDAPEAVIGDVAKPLKEMLGDYRKIETNVEAAIFKKFGVPFPLPSEVKIIDIAMLATEQRQLMRNDDIWKWTRGITPLDITIRPWSPEVAREQFLARFEELCPTTI